MLVLSGAEASGSKAAKISGHMHFNILLLYKSSCCYNIL
jgi:hypothetical protein